MRIGNYYARNAEQWPDGIACVDHGTSTTHRELNLRINRLANALADSGLGVGDRIGMLADNSTLVIEAYGAAAKAGLGVAPYNFRVSDSELRTLVEHSRVKLVILGRGYESMAPRLLGAFPGMPIIVQRADGDGGLDGYEQILSSSRDDEPTIAFDHTTTGLAIVYTSGTSGAGPKAVQLTHDQTTRHAACAVLEYRLDEFSRYLLALPHTSAGTVHNTIPQCAMAGACLVIEDVRNFDADVFLRNLEHYRITHTHIVPTMAFRVLNADTIEIVDTSSLEVLGYGGAPMPAPQVERLYRRFGPVIMDVYGMTEVGATATVLRRSDHRRFVESGRLAHLASAGRPVYDIEVAVLDESGTPVVVGESGEIAFRGPYVMHGYLDDPAASEAVFAGDGWLLSGDVGHLDDNGYLFVEDRKKDVIISGGLNVASREVEDVLYMHPDVLEAAVVGIEHPEWGEVITAAVVPARQVDEADLIRAIDQHCRKHLTSYKVPRAFSIQQHIPKNAMGKILKPEVRRLINATGFPAHTHEALR